MSRKDVVTACVYVCDFCGMTEHEVTHIVTGPKVRGDIICICLKCAELVVQECIAARVGADPTVPPNQEAA